MRRNQLYPALLAIIICIASPALSQTKPVIQGTVMDSLAGKPLTYATVELFRKIELTQPVRSAFTNESGKFSLPADSGMYTLIITHTGYGEKKLDVTVESVPVELPAIMLSKLPAGMEGIVVTARKPLIEQSDDKIIFNVENDPATKTESAIDILRKTPFVSVDGDNNIQVNGQSNFKVLLNGRETAMFAQNVKEALKGFPGALITKIEVITTPSAKYDAEGVGGIINIITRKKVVGYNGSIHNYYSSNGWFNTNTNFSAKFGKIGFTMYYGAGGGRNVKGQSRMETVPLVAAPFTRRELFGTRTMNNFWNFGNAELSWEYDSLNTISFYGNISGGNNRHVLNQEVTTAYTAGDSISRYTLNSRNEYPTKSAGADYIRKFASNKEREFSIRFNGEFGNSNTFLNSFMDYEVRD
ncbi:MAG TPA: carboxypeptidase regulatory-like domain-containing protein, partial [Flavisolibacter sp.]